MGLVCLAMSHNFEKKQIQIFLKISVAATGDFLIVRVTQVENLIYH